MKSPPASQVGLPPCQLTPQIDNDEGLLKDLCLPWCVCVLFEPVPQRLIIMTSKSPVLHFFIAHLTRDVGTHTGTASQVVSLAFYCESSVCLKGLGWVGSMTSDVFLA